MVRRAAEAGPAAGADLHDGNGAAGALRCQHAPPSVAGPDLITWAYVTDRFCRITALYRCRGHNAPRRAEIFSLNSERPVVGGVHVDDVTVAESDLAVAAMRVLNQPGRAVLDLARRGAQRAEDARLGLDADGPRIPVGRRDDAELAVGLSVGQDDVGEGLRPRPRLAGPPAPLYVPGSPVPVRHQLLGSGRPPPLRPRVLRCVLQPPPELAQHRQVGLVSAEEGHGSGFQPGEPEWHWHGHPWHSG